MFEGACLIFLVILGIIYAVIVAIEEKYDSDFDEVTEAKCKKCIYYDMCHKHGCDYECKDFRTNDPFYGKGVGK